MLPLFQFLSSSNILHRLLRYLEIRRGRESLSGAIILSALLLARSVLVLHEDFVLPDRGICQVVEQLALVAQDTWKSIQKFTVI